MHSKSITIPLILILLIGTILVNGAIAPDTTEQRLITSEAQPQKITTTSSNTVSSSSNTGSPFAFDIGGLKDKQASIDALLADRSKFKTIIANQQNTSTNTTKKDSSNTITGSNNQLRGTSNTV